MKCFIHYMLHRTPRRFRHGVRPTDCLFTLANNAILKLRYVHFARVPQHKVNDRFKIPNTRIDATPPYIVPTSNMKSKLDSPWSQTPKLVPGQITSSIGWTPPLPRLLHSPVFLPAPAWELFLVGNQCDSTRSLKPLRHVKELHPLTWE